MSGSGSPKPMGRHDPLTSRGFVDGWVLHAGLRLVDHGWWVGELEQPSPGAPRVEAPAEWVTVVVKRGVPIDVSRIVPGRTRIVFDNGTGGV